MKVAFASWMRGRLAVCNAKAVLALIALAANPLFFSGAFARPVSEIEKAALGETVREFDKAINGADYDRVVELSLTPRVIDLLAKKAGVQADVFRKAIVEQTGKAMTAVKLERASMNFAATAYKEAPNGVPYAVLATETLIAVPNMGRVLGRNDTIGVMDGGRWYLVRISEPQQEQIFREAYPEFVTVEFPKGTMEFVKE